MFRDLLALVSPANHRTGARHWDGRQSGFGEYYNGLSIDLQDFSMLNCKFKCDLTLFLHLCHTVSCINQAFSAESFIIMRILTGICGHPANAGTHQMNLLFLKNSLAFAR